MKKLFSLILLAALLAGCTAAPAETTQPPETTLPQTTIPQVTVPQVTVPDLTNANHVTFVEDGTVTVKGDGVVLDEPIVYYEAGHDFTYGEGEAWEAHTPEEAAAHTVVTITQPGTYVLSGKLHGQVAVDLGEEAETDPNAVVTLVLSGVDITCDVAPGIIFYNVYECGKVDDPKAQVDTSAAGANVYLAAGTENVVNGSHVARIYKPGSVVLSEDGIQVAESKKLHKYDAAFYSKMSMNVAGQGKLTIHADNEGLDSELHLTINSGDIEIFSGNDGINTNEDGVSVTTVNGGDLTITVTGETGEGDGIDSNGWLVINGGTVKAWACGTSADSGIDADMGIQLNGGTVYASGSMTDRMEGTQNFAVFSFAQIRKAAEFTLKNGAGEAVLSCTPANAFQNLVFSAPQLTEGTYTLWSGSTQFAGAAGQGGMGFGPVQRPDWPDRGDRNDPPDVEIPVQPTQPIVTYGQGGQGAVPDGTMPNFPNGEMPEGFQGQQPPEGFSGQMPENFNGQVPEGFAGQMPGNFNGQRPGGADGQMPENFQGQMPGGFTGPMQGGASGETSPEFEIKTGGNYFNGVTEQNT